MANKLAELVAFFAYAPPGLEPRYAKMAVNAVGDAYEIVRSQQPCTTEVQALVAEARRIDAEAEAAADRHIEEYSAQHAHAEEMEQEHQRQLGALRDAYYEARDLCEHLADKRAQLEARVRELEADNARLRGEQSQPTMRQPSSA